MIKLLVSSKPLSLIDFKESGMLLDFQVEKIDKEKIQSLVNKQDSLFGNPICYLFEDSLLTKRDLDFIVLNEINVMGTISKNTHSTAVKTLQGNDVEIINVDNDENEITPWNIVQSILDKTKKIKELVDKKNLKTEIEIDGGINFENCTEAKKAGANVLVSGSTIFKENQGDLKKNIGILRTN